jgi:hypothetical protein
VPALFAPNYGPLPVIDLWGDYQVSLRLEFEAVSLPLTVLTTRIRREFHYFRSKLPEKTVFVSKTFAAVARFSQT